MDNNSTTTIRRGRRRRSSTVTTIQGCGVVVRKWIKTMADQGLNPNSGKTIM